TIAEAEALSDYFNCKVYYGKLKEEKRKQALKAWLQSSRPIVATDALGLRLDIPDVVGVIHYSLPYNIKQYLQQTGQAGRNRVKV
ncbi:hypothetical protein LZ31DRAFT_482673, partial [Colletotrichum somersetense]